MGDSAKQATRSRTQRRRRTADDEHAVAPSAEAIARLANGGTPHASEVPGLQRSMGNAKVAALLHDRDEHRGHAEGPAPAIAASVSGAASPTVVRRDDTDSDTATSTTTKTTTKTKKREGDAKKSKGSSRKGASDPAAQAAIDGVVTGWGTVADLFATLRKAGRKVFDAASAGADPKQRKKLAKAQSSFDATVDAVDAELVEAYRQAVVCQLEVSSGVRVPSTTIAAMQQGLTAALTALLRHLMDGAKMAHEHGDAVRASVFTGMAQEAQRVGGLLDRGGGTAKPGTDHKGNLATVTGYADTANNAGPGVVGGGFGLVEGITGSATLTNVTSSASAISTGAGAVFGGLGVLFGTIGTALGIKAAVLGASSEKELRTLEPTLDSRDLQDAADYAANKKYKKSRHGAATAVAGGLATAAGIVGLVALSVATLGIGAAVLGIGAALIGLGFVIGKYLHKRSKRDAYAKMLADGLIDGVQQGDAAARQQIEDRGLDPDDVGTATEGALRKALVAQLKEEGRNRREDMAATVYAALIGDDVADQIDAERLVEALHLDPTKLRTLDPAAARSKIASKMASW